VLDRRRFLAKAAAAGLVLGGSSLGLNELAGREHTHRGNYLIPPRAQRSYPLLPGREAALA